MEAKQDAPRLRLATDIDMSKAKPSCSRCKGTGRAGYRTIDDPENPGQRIRVPVVCRCVTRRGGVKRDMLDDILEQTRQQLEDGTFAQHIADDICGLPTAAQHDAIEKLERASADEAKPANIRLQLRTAVGMIRQRMKEDAHGNA